MHPDHKPYFRLTGRSRLDKAVNSLAGMIEGVALDGTVGEAEISFLNLWLAENQELRSRHPFNELMPVVEEALSDNVLTEDEKQDILWLCRKFRSTGYYDAVTADIQELHGIVSGIRADGVITEAELEGLSEWLMEHDHLKRCWPYDEIDALVTSVMADHKIDETEHKVLKDFFSEFVALLDNKTIVTPLVFEGNTVNGLCALCPEIEFSGSLFCFTGASAKYTRNQFSELVESLGGRVTKSVTSVLDYLVIGADGNPCWAYACYGRKVEAAVHFRKQGAHLLLIHENDFHDAVADLL
jgi:BRCA1 C Terminus (BRCT) domain